MTKTAYNIYQEILNYYNTNKKFPTVTDLCNKFKVSKYILNNYIKELLDNKLLIKEGKNYIVQKQYRVPKQEIKKENKILNMLVNMKKQFSDINKKHFDFLEFFFKLILFL